MDKENCARCGNKAETYNFEQDSTFWGSIKFEVKTTVTRGIHILNHYWRRNPPPGGSEMLKADERQALCLDCSDLLIARFLQGRSVPALPGKEYM